MHRARPAALLTASSLLLAAGPASAKRQDQSNIPNGATAGCLACHVNPTGRGDVTAFYTDYRQARKTWSQALARLDSDGDGFTNGQELQDPDGAWRRGDPQPGDPAAVSNPGNADDTPPAEGEGEGEGEECPDVDVGAPCEDDAACGDGGDCLLFPGGYCMVDRATGCCPDGSEESEVLDGSLWCLKSCEEDGDCREDEGHWCDDGTCWSCTVAGDVPVGDPCTSDDDCAEFGTCLTEADHGYPGGTCAVDSWSYCCPEGTVDIAFNEEEGEEEAYCLKGCELDGECRDGYRCNEDLTVCDPREGGEGGEGEGEGEGEQGEEGEGEGPEPIVGDGGGARAGGDGGGCGCRTVGGPGSGAWLLLLRR